MGCRQNILEQRLRRDFLRPEWCVAGKMRKTARTIKTRHGSNHLLTTGSRLVGFSGTQLYPSSMSECRELPRERHRTQVTYSCDKETIGYFQKTPHIPRRDCGHADCSDSSPREECRRLRPTRVFTTSLPTVEEAVSKLVPPPRGSDIFPT